MSSTGLQKLYSFDDNDLSYNRAGNLSPKQQENRTQSQKSGVLPGIGCGIFFFLIAAILPVTFIPLIFTVGKDIGLAGIIGISFGALAWLLVWGGIGIYITDVTQP